MSTLWIEQPAACAPVRPDPPVEVCQSPREATGAVPAPHPHPAKGGHVCRLGADKPEGEARAAPAVRVGAPAQTVYLLKPICT